MKKLLLIVAVFWSVLPSFAASFTFEVRYLNSTGTNRNFQMVRGVGRTAYFAQTNIVGDGVWRTNSYTDSTVGNSNQILAMDITSMAADAVPVELNYLTWTTPSLGYYGFVLTNAVVETNCNHTFLIRNNTTHVQTYYIGTSIDSATNIARVLGPGQTGLIGVNGHCTNVYKVYANLYGSTDEDDWLMPVNPEVTPVGYNPTNTSVTVINENDPITTYTLNPTNGPITFSGTNDSRDGFSALYDAITKGAAENNLGLAGISNAIAGLDVGGEGSGTNVSDSGTHGRLDQIYNLFTNSSGLGDYQSVVTNTAAGDYSAQNEPLVESLAGLRDGTIDDSVPTGSGDAHWQVELLPGVPFNFRPSRMFGDVFAVAYKIFSWLLLLAYFTKVLHDIFHLVKVAGQTNQMKIPDAQITIFGVGGNWGIALVGFFAGLLLLAYSAMLAAAVTSFTTVLTGQNVLDFLAGPFSGVPTAALEGIAESALFFPWSFFIGLTGSYIIWLATKNVIAAGIVLKIRMMFS